MTALSWSGGKDCCWGLNQLMEQGQQPLLFCTISADTDRVMMHGVPRDIIQQQARCLGLELYELAIPSAPDNSTYEQYMGKAIADLKEKGVTEIAFGDLYLEDLREYREEKMAGTGLAISFPIWTTDTQAQSRRFIDAGFRAKVVCIDKNAVPVTSLAAEYDHAFLDSLPEGVDPCGENGEFHTLVYDGPIFREPLKILMGLPVFHGYTEKEPDRFGWISLSLQGK